ncbi:MAG: ATP-binding protein [Maribacter arcticus]|uniref:ATP-binding protein n=1 Tax=Maribacter arcticus TaxID=561365 RepID=UPI0030010ABF
MKPTKKIEAAVLDVYHKWLHSYLNGDVKTYDSYFDNSFHFIGSTNNEEFLTRKDTTNFFKATAEQLAGKTQLRNETKIIEQFGELVFITHLFDAWFLNGNDWSFYGRFRFSNILEQNKDGWHFVYQHYSTPDSKAQDGETIGFNQITKENLELREAIQRRTVELEEKNKELEIEGSLERIRAKALAMTSSEDLLDVVVTLRTEFLKLGHEAQYFWHMMWLPDKYEKAMTSGDGTRIGMVMELPRHIHGKIPLLANWEKSTDPMVIYTMDAESAIDYVDKMITLGDFKQVDPQAPTHDDIRHIGGLTFIMARTTHGEIGYSLPGVVENPPKEDLEILVKFAGAFDLAHRRFLDLQKAEKQRREVEIALALEKVRSRTMGMQRSDELRDTAMLLFQQIEELGINSFACGFNIWDDDKKAATAWMASTYGLQPSFKTNSAEDVYLLFFEAEKRGESLFILEQKGKELEDHYKYLKTIPEVKNLSDTGVSFPTYQIIHCAYFSKGYLMFITLEPVPDAHDIFKRFAKVFEQTYSRFLELQKAEAQVREAKIEAALERVRSRTMAMQNSTELAETSIDMFKQMQTLGMRPWACGFNIFEKDEKAVTQWMSAVDGGLQPPFTTPLTENPFFIKISEARQRGEELFVMESGGQELEETYTYMFNLPGSKKAFGDIMAAGFEMPKFQISHCAFFSQGYLMFITYEPYPEAYDIFKRFAKVFEQTYTRFFDLQKAEAQVREAQIEAALEKVRSRSLAMHKPDELGEVVGIVLEKLQEIGITNDGEAVLWERKEGSRDTIHWLASDQNFSTVKFFCPYLGVAYDSYLWDQGEKGLHFFAHTFSYEEKNEYWDWAFVNSDWKYLPDERKTWMLEQESISLSVAWTEKSGIMIPSYANKILTEQEGEILLRFSKVFEQAYTRFLDLQKAEAQAREAQIEGALERVRSRSLAMHNSEELLAVIEVVSEQLRLLDLKFDTVSFGKNYQKSDFKFWLTSSGQPKPVLIQVPFFDSRVLKSVIEAQKKEIDFIADVFTKEENRAWSAHMIQHSALKNFPEQVKDFILNSPGFARSSFLMQHIDLYVGNYRAMPFTDEENAIFKRFAQVFAQAYTRFLDLQKAEDQAKEALIEAALERVRSRTMAMQHSTELNDTSALLFQQIQMLGVPPWSCGFNIWEKEDTVFTSYMGSPDGGILKGYKIPLTEEAAFIHFKESRDRGDKLFIDVLEGNALETHYRYFQTLPGIKEIFEKRAQAGYPIPTFQINHLANFSHGNLMFITYEHCPEAHDIFIRFAKVFEQTYTRFLDLQKAEALARESEIQLALERVRARTMAMQSSKELADTAFVLFEQLRNLGGELWGTGFGLCAENSDKDEFWFANKNGVFPPVVIPNTADPAHKEMYQGWRKKVDFLSIEKSGKALKQHYNYMLSIAEVSPFFQKIMDEGLQLPERQQWNAAYFSKGYLLIITIEPYPDVEILKRFAKVFDQTYTRFLDLKKAEEQAREAKIEAALERVRAQSMAMHKSEELKYVIQTVYDQFVILNINIEHTGFIVDYKENDSMHIWLADKNEVPTEVTIPYFDTAHWNSFIQAKEMGKGFFANLLTFEEKNKFYRELFTHIENVSEKTIEFYMNCPGLAISTVLLDNVGLYIENFEGTPYTEGENNILMRFGKVFQQTYTRFLDLKKAEAQTREAQIEAALEKVRSRTMAMRNSSELAEASNLLDEQVKSLGIQTWGCAFHVYADNVEGDYEWFSSKNGRLPFYKTPREDFFLDFYEKGQRGEKFHVEEFVGAKCQAHYDYLKTIPLAGDSLKAMEESGITLPTYQIDHVAFFKHGYILFITYEPVPEAHDIFKRFAKVFEQTYTRFLDLQKAEAQTREAQIEAALEKVRSRTMAMQKGEEVKDVVVLLYKELIALGVTNFASCGYVEINEETQLQSTWVTSPGGDSLGLFYLPLTGDVHFDARYKAWKKQQTVFHQTVAGKERKKHLEYAITTFNSKEAEEMVLNQFPDPTVFYCFNFSHGYLHVVAGSLLTEEEEALLARFTKVFEQTYARFLDLEKAEAQTREAQINLAVERVRAKALAMHKSEEIIELVAKLKNEVMSLDIPDVVAATIFLNEGDDKVRMWDLSSLEDEDNYSEVPFDITFKLKKSDPNLYVKRVWENPENYFVEIQEEKDLKRLMLWLREQNKNEIADEVEDFIEKIQLKRLYHSAKKLNNGKLVIDQLNPPSDEMETILTKMGAAFDLAYKRFEDLKKAEAQAREAQIEAALERVRSRTLAMQKSEELAETSVIVFKQLLELGIAPTRLFIGIINDNATKVEAWATNEDGSKIAKHFTLEALKNKSIKKMITGWKQQKKSIVIDMKGKELQEYFYYLNKDMKIPFINGLKQKRRVQTIAYFSGGLIGMAAPEEQPENSIRLLERFAAVFNLTYTRFKDLKIAEANAEKAEQDLIKLQAAKKSAEEALTELQLTQNQLIQSEKMASLGELTAGIAHEIQNPLNFVNNFSEVSNELIDEMNEELDKGDLEEAKAISLDIKQNLEKINHHGKRADAIVKGMLQHSRSSSGTKEPTDINALADEYLRLAYHGLRAKDKSFNATLETHFDNSIGTVNIMPQDMGRVILNLITNAFYAVNEKKQHNENFKPIVSVSTIKVDNHIRVNVSDNGDGIPQKVLDKIFQPFFTTKPTGQGTGLGLSMSYDIITKGHSGKLNVETKEGEGSKFSIHLPINN